MDRPAPLTDAEFAALMAPLGPFGAAPRLAAGVSGGPHSLALALLADAWARARGGSLLALVADHGLRPGSGAEAEGVAALLAARGIAARLLRLGLAPGPGLQERARAARQEALLAACREEGRPWLLLGHHRADQAETLLFRALRGSGPAGLAGMAPAREAAAALVLRPLLGVPPARLEAVLEAAGIAPVRDPSNADPRFARARLRQALGDPGGTGPATAALAEAAGAFARRRAAREAAVAERLAVAARLHPEGWAEIEPAALGADAVAGAALAALL
ncbi:tRNA lysidine(34) synthetase TilS, partial [Crenalkalicoccus roseus]|uniref:tRNA lysidine(34) synthetase TilS n=1 Tax=Crenalkalicoccus roseus TaxID=1485588 RepID=UPI00107FDD98